MRKNLILLFLLSLILRIYGLNWDQGFHLHPDERFLTMVSVAMNFSGNYFDTDTSLLNPHNIGHDFYVYGTWPAIVVRAVSAVISWATYDKLILVGRFLSAWFDSGTTVLIFLVSLHIFKTKKIAFYSALFYSFAVLPIQLSHFYAVDTFLVFFLTLSLYFLISHASPILLGLSFGLAVSAKVSAILFLPIILLYYLALSLREALAMKQSIPRLPRSLRLIAMPFLLLFASLLITVRLFYPYLFDGLSLNSKVIQNWQTLKSFDVPGYFPPGVQWINFSTVNAYLNTLFFGLGLPLGLIFLFTLINIKNIIKKYPLTGLLYIWIFGLLLYQGLQFAKPLRYLYPIYPSICILAGYLVSKLDRSLIIGISLVIVIWCLGFTSMYTRPHSRVLATGWILRNIPAGSTISCEYWDDCLPLVGYDRYQTIQLSPYDLPDTEQKISHLKVKISNLDYIVMSSNRLFGGISSAPQLYPHTSQFYADLFSGRLGFTKIAELSSRPNLPIPGIDLCFTPPYFNYGFISKIDQQCTQGGISLVDDYAEESFTVYDHPKIIIFKNNNL